MTTTLHARVRRMEIVPRDPMACWIAVAYITEDGELFVFKNRLAQRHRYTYSWHEAMLWAYRLRADLERDLMDEIHESRSSRRQQVTA